MNSLQEAAYSMCVALITLGVIGILIPSGKNNRVVTAVFSVCTVLAVVLPISGRTLSPQKEALYTFADADLQKMATRQMQETTEEQIAAMAKEYLASAGIVCEEISVSTDISEEHCIEIEYIILNGSWNGQEKQRAEDIIRGAFGLENVEAKTYED